MQTIVELPIPTRAIAIYSIQPVPLPVNSQGATQTPEQILARQYLKDDEMLAGLSKAKRSILKALATFHLLTAEQITRLLYQPSSYAWVNNTHLQFLTEQELIEKILPAKQTQYGRAPFVFRLSRTGRLVAKELGYKVTKRYRSFQESTNKLYPLAHILAVNEFLIKAVLLAKYDPDIVLRKFLHDKELFANPLKVQIPNREKPAALRSDSWLDIGQMSTRRRYCFCVEQNLTAVKQNEWREMIRKYLYCLPAYKERFGTDIITVIVSIQTGTDFPIKPLSSLTQTEWEERREEAEERQHRLRNYLDWTQAELEAQHRMSDADMFRFSCAPLDQISPTELFYTPHWEIPYRETPVSLLMPQRKEADGV
jgi:hypothetical protein